MRLEGKRIIVTGGSGGIAGGTIRAYVREGAKVASVDVRDEEGERIVEEANEQAQGPGHATYHHCDMSKGDEIFRVFDEVAEDLGGLDVLAHLAARDDLRDQPEELTEKTLNEFWAININGTIISNQAAFKHFKEQKHGVIINYASDVGLAGSPIQGAYSASKGAVLAWTRAIANSNWARQYNVRANCVNPQIMSRLYQGYVDSLDPEAKAKFIEGRKVAYPIDGWPGDSDRDSAPVMVFLASEDSRFIHGQTICVNGGAMVVR